MMVSQNGHDDGPRVGALLRASRLRCGEEAVDVSRVLHIRLAYIDAIEEGRYDDLPGAAYAVGFIRAYADHLGLDSDEVVRRFKAETSGLDTSTELKFLSPIPERGIPRGAILFVGMMVAVLAYGGWYVSSTRDHFLTDLIPPLPDRLAALLPTDDGTDAQTPPAAPGPTVVLAGDAPQTDTAAADREAADPKPAMPGRVSPLASPQPVPPSADTAEPVEATPAPVVTDVAETPPITETSIPVVAEVAETPPLAETPAPVVAEVAETPTIAETPAPVVAEITETLPREETPVVEAAPAAPEPAVQTVAEIAEILPPPAMEPSSEPTPGETSLVQDEAVPAPVVAITDAPEQATPAVAEAVAEVQQPTPPTAPAPETSTILAEVVETPGPADDGGATAEAPPAEAAGGDDGDQVAALTEDAGRRLADDAATPAEQGESRIMVRARMASWIQVRDDVGNQLLMTRLMRAGDTFRVPDRPGLKLLTGNAGALEILVDGETVPPLGPVGAVRRDVTLDIDRLREGTAAIE